jgi:hypothetical protein
VAAERRNHGQRWRVIFVWMVLAAIVFFVAVSAYASHIARRDLVRILENHYHSAVQLKEFHVAVFFTVRIVGTGLVLQQRNQINGPPFIAVDRFSAQAGIFDLLGSRKRLRSVKLQGLQINVIPRSQREAGEQPAAAEAKTKSKIPDFVMDDVTADRTLLRIIPAFRGTARMQAELSQMTTGIKSVFLKLVQPLFKGKHAGTVLPIKISGTRDHPSFALDVSRIMKK